MDPPLNTHLSRATSSLHCDSSRSATPNVQCQEDPTVDDAVETLAIFDLNLVVEKGTDASRDVLRKLEGSMSKLLFMALAVLTGCDGDDEVATPRLSPCEQLREHLIDLRLADAMHVDKDAHREAMRDALGTDFLASCEKFGDETVACALAATDSSGAAACAPGTAR